MKTKVFAVLGIIAAITGLNIPVQAQSPAVPSSDTGRFNLSSESLAELNSRTADMDYARFFNKINPRQQRNLNLSNPNSTSLQISEDLQLFLNQRTLPIDPILGPDQPYEEVNTVEVQIDPSGRGRR